MECLLSYNYLVILLSMILTWFSSIICKPWICVHVCLYGLHTGTIQITFCDNFMVYKPLNTTGVQFHCLYIMKMSHCVPFPWFIYTENYTTGPFSMVCKPWKCTPLLIFHYYFVSCNEPQGTIIVLCSSKIYLKMYRYPVSFPSGSLHDIYRKSRIPLWCIPVLPLPRLYRNLGVILG